MEQFEFKPTYSREDRGVQLIATADIPLPAGFVAVGSPALVVIAPGGWAANHCHEHREVWLGNGEGLYLTWEENGERHEAQMAPLGSDPRAFAVAPNVPHLVENRGDQSAILFELKDGESQVISLEGVHSLRGIGHDR